jgi:hypothetical protein
MTAPSSAMPEPPHVHTVRPPDRRNLIIAAVGLVVAVALGLYFFMPRVGGIIVTVSGPGNKPLDAVEVYLNGELKCASSPCTIAGLEPDTYMLRASAVGYQAIADTAVRVTSGDKAVHNLTLQRALGTGIKVIAEGSGLKLYVDGKEIGPLPQELKDMEPGDHVIKVAGNDRFEPFETSVNVVPEQMQTIGPLKLKVVRGLASIVPGEGAEGARVLLVSGSDRRTLPKLPINLDIPTNRPHSIVASKSGYATFNKPIAFEDGKAEKTFEVTLVPVDETAEAQPATGRSSTRRTAAPRSPSPAPAPAASSGSATLNINSIPVSNVILDGRPLGPTPKVGVRVAPGAHTIVFVSGSDRKSATVNVTAGQTKTVAVRF